LSGAGRPNWAWRDADRLAGTLRIHVAQSEDVVTPSPKRFELDLNNLLHPAQA
jgi:hypothetical protein